MSYLRINSIMKNSTDQAFLSDKLNTLLEDYDKVITENETLAATNKNLTNDNENLRNTNMKLFLKVGEERKDPEPKEDSGEDPGEDTEKQKIDFESLFNENGELK